MNITGMTKGMNCFGRTLRFCNQKSRDWTRLYEYDHNGSTLCEAGCGVFALVHAVEWMHGIRLDPDAIHVMPKSEYSGMFGDYSSFSNEFDDLSVAEAEAEP